MGERKRMETFGSGWRRGGEYFGYQNNKKKGAGGGLGFKALLGGGGPCF